MVTQITPINLVPGTMIPRVNISQYDTGARVLKFQVYNGDSLFTFTNAMSVALVGTKPDGKGFSYTGTIASNMPTFDVTAQMSAVAGKVRAELVVFENGERVGSGNFVIFVEEGALGDGTDMSDSDYAIINDALEAAFDLDHFYADLQNMVTEAVEDIQVIQGQTVIDPTLTVSGAAADAKATGDMARNFLEALMTETTTEANVATTDDAAGGLPLKQFVGNIQPAQAGTGDPSPTNVRQISGYTSVTVTRAGKNIAKPIATTATMAGLSWAVTADGKVTATGTATGTSQVNYDLQNNVLSLPKNVPLIVNGSTASLAVRVCYRTTDAPSTTVTLCTSYNGADATGTIPENAKDSWVRVLNNAGTGVAINAECYPFVRIGGTVEYEAPAVVTYPVTFPTAAGTVYGGTLTLNSDGSGTLTVTKNVLATFDGTENWTVAAGAHPSYIAPRGTIPANAKGMVSNMLIMDDTQTAVNGHGYVGTTNLVCYIDDASTDNLAAWKAKLAETPLQVVYTLATPTTYALTVEQVQMLQGDNNIWMDAAGTVQATYYANTALYVEKRIAELQALVLENQ